MLPRMHVHVLYLSTAQDRLVGSRRIVAAPIVNYVLHGRDHDRLKRPI